MPVLSEDQLNLLNNKISYVRHKNIICNINYWDNGYIKSIDGLIKTINVLNNYIVITNSYEFQRF
ncbi:TPA: YolD-like family protein [Staphylococcus aureus]